MPVLQHNRKIVTGALCASELRYRRLFESAYDGILIVDPESRKIIDVNPYLVEFLGYSYEEFIGKELFEIGLLKDEAASQAAFRLLQKSGYIRYDCLPLETKDGRRVDVEFVSNLYREDDKQVIQCNIRDISRRKKIEDTLSEARAQQARRSAELESLVDLRTAELRRSNSQLQMFAYSIAHDLRSPLQIIQGFSQLLIDDHAPNLNAEGQSYAKFVGNAAKQLDLMLSDLLAFSQASQLNIKLSPVALETVVEKALTNCAMEISEGNARIETSSPWPSVLAHEATLRQVLVNLIGNAVKFVRSGRPQVRLRAEERPGEIVRVWVEDNGIGIPAEFRERIFKVFQRLHTKKYAGTGIGLAIVQQGVERMGGRVGVESSPGKGSSFWFELAKAPTRAVKPKQKKETAR